MERIRTFRHKGKLINCFDYRGLIEESDFLDALHAATAFLQNQNKKTLHLVNLTDAYITTGLIKPIMAEIEHIEPFVLKEAVIGITGAKRVLFQTYATFFTGNVKSFPEEAAALDWLVSD